MEARRGRLVGLFGRKLWRQQVRSWAMWGRTAPEPVCGFLPPCLSSSFPLSFPFLCSFLPVPPLTALCCADISPSVAALQAQLQHCSEEISMSLRSRHLRVWEHVLIGPARPPDSAARLVPCPPAGVSPSTRGACVRPQALGSRVGVSGVGGVSLYLLSGTPTASATFHEPPAVPKSAACAPHSFS